MKRLSIIATILSITGAILIALMSPWGFVAWIGANSIWLIDNYQRRYFEQMPIWMVFIGTSILGLLVWGI